MDSGRDRLGSGQRIIGITGGIGTGKTTVSQYLERTHQLPVLDADILAREAVQPGSNVLRDLVDRYGSGILLPDGHLNRSRLGEIIFNSPAERLWVEQRIHPYVRDRLLELMYRPPLNNAHQTPVLVLVIPLLFEARMTDLVTEVWVVSCRVEQQLERLQQRDHLTIEQAYARINSQMPLEKKLAQADVILDNSSKPETLLQQVDQALNQCPMARLAGPLGLAEG